MRCAVLIRETKDGSATIEMTAAELFVCRAALREVLYGFKCPDFEPRMGCTREMAAAVLDSLPKLAREDVEKTMRQ